MADLREALRTQRPSLELQRAAADEIARLDAVLAFLEEQAQASRTGVTIQRIQHIEDGYVVERGFRVMRRHFVTDLLPTMEQALERAMEECPR